MSRPVWHRAGPMVGHVQRCEVCGEILADYRGLPEDPNDRRGGFRSGYVTKRTTDVGPSVVLGLATDADPCGTPAMHSARDVIDARDALDGAILDLELEIKRTLGRKLTREEEFSIENPSAWTVEALTALLAGASDCTPTKKGKRK